MSLLEYLKKSGKTIIIVIHDLQLATHYCDELYLLKNGQNVVNGSSSKVLTEENVKKVFEVSGNVVLNEKGKPEFKLNI
ncbi:hypothetical protein psyc5s11_34640 [Clostridium gelidum]|uniref:Uncharacterized protein n=1 Tax=Clostridium gelidum TaxID=704125 RepID=A0ABN6IZI0_9CLOT|nr:hypothetical protein [Clostridium gelidum]BCZ47397.1 hypothetical protein psyc5s11_34640 [Clostridium gelidum]